MRKVRAAVKTRSAALVLLALLAIIAHAAPVMLFASSITPFQVWFSRDEYFAAVGSPNRAYNFNDLVDQRTNTLNFTDLTIGGDIAVQNGALGFAPPWATLNFGVPVFAWGADFTALRAGRYNFWFGGQNTLIDASTSTQFIGFSTPALRIFNISFIPTASAQAAPDAEINFVIDNVIANTVPEPSTLLLLAMGGGLVGLSYRRRKAADQSDAVRDIEQADPM